ncbi:unnamed protein product [Effrenium voratum]|nr:unnamed protein product [Effrenium voratum]
MALENGSNFEPDGNPRNYIHGLFATFAARRRREAAQEPTFISLNPSYEEDFMAKQKAKGE